MILDLNQFSYGAGIVMTGWICGMVVGTILNMLSRLGE